MSGANLSGKCLCGAVSVSAKISEEDKVGACHCSMCRKWSGGTLLAVHVGERAFFKGEENITVFRSSEWAERGFCKLCGTNLFWRFAGSGDYVIPAGLFDAKEDWHFNNEIYIDEKPEWYTFSNETNKMTRAEVEAMFSGDAS